MTGKRRKARAGRKAPPGRANQRVRDFLESGVLRGNHAGSRPLPTIRGLARELGVSPRTVQKVYNDLATEGRIHGVPGRGTFTVSRELPQGRGLRIGLNVEMDHYDRHSVWAYTLYGALLQAAITSGRNAVFTGFDEALELHSAADRTDGFILFPDAHFALRQLRERAPEVPVVFLNPPVVAETTDFVSPDYHGMGHLLGKAWAQSGKRRIAVVHHPDPELSASGQLTLSGLIAGLGEHFNALEFLKLLAAPGFSEEAGHRAMTEALENGLPLPDAVFCKGDLLALGILRTLREAGARIPDELSVVGGSGLELSETEWPRLTRARQPFQLLGQELFSMLLRRIDGGGISLPGRFLPMFFIGGASTSPAENEFLLAGGERQLEATS